jgi:fibronectin type 3 domain-containing protein
LRVRRKRVWRFSILAVAIGVTAVFSAQGANAILTEPSAPANLTATAGNQIVQLSWDAAQANIVEIDHYNVYRSDTCSAPECGAFYASVPASQTTYDDENVTNASTYYYQVSAVNTLGQEGAQSDVVSATPFDPELPGPPQNLTASTEFREAGDSVHFTVLLTWQPPARDGGTEIIQYNVYGNSRSPQDSSPTTLLARVRGDVLEYTDRYNGPSCGHQYFVTAVNTNGEGPPSSASSGGPGC